MTTLTTSWKGVLDTFELHLTASFFLSRSASGSLYALLPFPVLTGSGLKGKRAKPLQLPRNEPPDQKDDGHLAALKRHQLKQGASGANFPNRLLSYSSHLIFVFDHISLGASPYPNEYHVFI